MGGKLGPVIDDSKFWDFEEFLGEFLVVEETTFLVEFTAGTDFFVDFLRTTDDEETDNGTVPSPSKFREGLEEVKTGEGLEGVVGERRRCNDEL